MRAPRVIAAVGVLVALLGTAVAAGAGTDERGATRAATTANEKYVAAAVADALGRPVTDADLDRWARPLDGGQSHGDFAAALIGSSDRKAHLVSGIYQKVLLRQPDEAGLAYWTNKLVTGFRSAHLAAALYASHEFYDGAGGTNDAYVRIMYLSLLQREADPLGLAYWVGRLDKGTPRSALARSFYLARESNARRVEAIFQQFLDREPSRTDLTYWRVKLTTTEDDLLVTFLVGSDEYFQWAQVRPDPSSTTTTTQPPVTNPPPTVGPPK